MKPGSGGWGRARPECLHPTDSWPAFRGLGSTHLDQRAKEVDQAVEEDEELQV